MNVSFESIINHLNFSKIKSEVKTGKMGQRNKIPIAVEYIFEIVNPGITPPETVRTNLQKYHEVDNDDKIWYYVIDDFGDCLDLLKKLRNHFNFALSHLEEISLKKEFRRAERLLLFILQPPILEG